MQNYDVFLSYKHTDKNGNLTPEVAMAEELYRALTEKGIRVFYSIETLGLLGEPEFKDAIDNALDDAYILVAIGSSVDNLMSNWVKYEWDSFYKDILNRKREGKVFSYISGVDINELPRTLRQVQTFNKPANSVDEICTFIINALKNHEATCKTEDCSLRILSMRELETFGITSEQMAESISQNDHQLYAGIPSEIAGTAEQWAEVFHRFPDFCAFIVDEQYQVYGNYSMVGLTELQAKKMRSGDLQDCDIHAETADNLYFPGMHSVYLLNLSVNSFAESAELYRRLWDALAESLVAMAKKDGIYLSEIYYKAFLAEHEAKVASRGFCFCCNDKLFGKVFVHDMDPSSTLLSFDKTLANTYAANEVFSKLKMKKHREVDVEALSAHMDFWRQISELFLQPRFLRLKKYFFNQNGIPQNPSDYILGLSVAEWLRDLLQYSSALLPYISKDQAETHKQFEKKMLECPLIKDSMEQYRFSTETKALSVDIEAETISVKSIVTFAHIWLDIDRLFMEPDLIALKPFFYERHAELPDDEHLELCEGLALRILTGMKISEDQLRYLPEEFVESYYDYKCMISEAEIVQQTLSKYPFIRAELFPRGLL